MRRELPALIDPYDAERVVNCSYELRMGSEAFVTARKQKTKLSVDAKEKIRIPPGQFAQLLTKERVTIPDDALGLISVKFTLKQRGLVNVSGFHVDPGYSNTLLFSVYNAGPQDVVLSPDDPAFLLWYCSLEGTTKDLYNGTRVGRDGITSSDVGAVLGEVATPQALASRLERVEFWQRTAGWVVAAVASVLIAIFVTDAVRNDDNADSKPSQESTSTIVNQVDS